MALAALNQLRDSIFAVFVTLLAPGWRQPGSTKVMAQLSK